MTSRPCSSIPSGSGTWVKPQARRWCRSAWIVGVHGPEPRRTVSPTRTTGVMLPPGRTISSSVMLEVGEHRGPRPRLAALHHDRPALLAPQVLAQRRGPAAAIEHEAGGVAVGQ